MKKNSRFLIILVLIFFLPIICYSQINQKRITIDYETLYKKIKDNDSLIFKKHREYECSKSVFGELEYYRKDGKLKLIIHGYVNDVNDEFSYEHYYLEDDELVLYVKFQEMIRFNTTYFKSKDQSSAGMEKVLDLSENRIFFDNATQKINCFERKHMEVYSKWDSDYFANLALQPVDCNEDYTFLASDLNRKYRLLIKAENKLPYSRFRKPKCLFHIW